MPNVPGVDTALLAKVNLDSQLAFSNSQMAIETLKKDTKTIDMLVAKQQALGSDFITPLVDPTKKHDVTVRFVDFCSDTATDVASDPCADFDADMANVIEKPYAITSQVQASFGIEEDKLKTSRITVEEMLTKHQVNALNDIIRKLNTKSVLFLDANIGYNAGAAANGWTFANSITEVPSGQYDMSLIPSLMQDMLYNRVPDSFLLDGGRLFKPYTNAKLEMGNAEGKGNAAKANVFDMEVDIHGFVAAGLPNTTYSVAPYSYAFLTKNYYKNSMPEFIPSLFNNKGGWAYSITLEKYGIPVDVFYTKVCVNATENKYKWVFLYKCHYEFVASPAGCDLGGGNIVTGINRYDYTQA